MGPYDFGGKCPREIRRGRERERERASETETETETERQRRIETERNSQRQRERAQQGASPAAPPERGQAPGSLAQAKGLRTRNSPICTLSQNGYGAGIAAAASGDAALWRPRPH